MTLQVVFEPGTDLDIATVEVNNRVKRVEALLPQAVLQNGVKVDKTNPAMLLIVTMQSKTGQFDRDYLSNLANSNVVPELKRVGGVGDVMLFGYPYAMRIWLNPDQLAKYKLTVADVAQAIREQNQNYAVGEIGTSPAATGQVLTFPVQTTGTLQRAQGLRGHHRARGGRRLGGARARRRARRARRRGLPGQHAAQRPAGHGHRRLPASRRECAARPPTRCAPR